MYIFIHVHIYIYMYIYIHIYLYTRVGGEARPAGPKRASRRNNTVHVHARGVAAEGQSGVGSLESVDSCVYICVLSVCFVECVHLCVECVYVCVDFSCEEM